VYTYVACEKTFREHTTANSSNGICRFIIGCYGLLRSFVGGAKLTILPLVQTPFQSVC